jgi:hypothetical protein
VRDKTLLDFDFLKFCNANPASDMERARQKCVDPTTANNPTRKTRFFRCALSWPKRALVSSSDSPSPRPFKPTHINSWAHHARYCTPHSGHTDTHGAFWAPHRTSCPSAQGAGWSTVGWRILAAESCGVRLLGVHSDALTAKKVVERGCVQREARALRPNRRPGPDVDFFFARSPRTRAKHP